MPPTRRKKPTHDTAPQPARTAAAHPDHGVTFYTAADLARRWAMSERHIRRLIDTHELEAHRFGRSVRISRANVLQYEALASLSPLDRS